MLAAVAPMAARLGLVDEALDAAWRGFRKALRKDLGWPWVGSALFEVASQLAPSQRTEIHRRAYREVSRAKRSRRARLLETIANELESPLRESAAQEACLLASQSSQEAAASTIVTVLPALPASARVAALLEVASLSVEQLFGRLKPAISAISPADRPPVVAELARQFREHGKRSTDAHPRTRRLEELVPFAEGSQAEELCDEAIVNADAILDAKEPSDRAAFEEHRRTIDGVIPYMSTFRLRALLRSHFRIEDTTELAKVMAVYSPSGGPAWEQALVQARAVQVPASRAEALAEALAELAAAATDPSLLEEALAAAAAASGRDLTGRVFGALAARACARKDWAGALEVARRAPASQRPDHILRDIAREAQLELAAKLAETPGLGTEDDRTWIRLAVADRMEGDEARSAKREALRAALSPSVTWPTSFGWLAAAFASVAEGLDLDEAEALARDVLGAAEAKRDGIEALIAIAPHLPESFRGEAARLARSIGGNEAPRASAAIAAASQLASVRSEMFAEAWQLAMALPDLEQACALGALAGTLPEEYATRLLTATLALGDAATAIALERGVAAALSEPGLSRAADAVDQSRGGAHSRPIQPRTSHAALAPR